VCAIIAITLTLDYLLLATVFTDWKRNWANAATAYTQAYVRALASRPRTEPELRAGLGHDLLYRFQTDRYGFRTGACAPGESEQRPVRR
jgi:hypothetical protein